MMHSTVSSRPRAGFTLIELAVSITIIAILTGVTITAINVSQDESRINSAASNVRAFLEGARNRAVFAESPRGLRLYIDHNVVTNRALVNTIQYIGNVDSATAGTIEVQRPDVEPPLPGNVPGDGSADNSEAYVLLSTDSNITNWDKLFDNGLLTYNSRIRLGNWWYQIRANGLDNLSAANHEIHITPYYRDASGTATDIPAGTVLEGDHEITLSPAELEGEEPFEFRPRTYIDLTQLENDSKLPGNWDISTSGPGYVDILFNPLGTVEGPLAGHGVLHLPIVDLNDLDDATILELGNANKEGNERIVTLFTQSGQLSINAVSQTDDDTDGNADDPYKFAETGATE